MEEISDRFIILKAVDSGEKNKKLTIFGENLGKIIVIARGVKSEKAKLKFLCLPFCVCDGVFFKMGNTLVVKTAKVLHSFMGLTQSPQKFNAASIVQETMLKFYNLNANSLNSSITALELIENCDENENIFALKFLVDLVYANFNLNLGCCNACGETKSEKVFLNFQTGELRCLNCREISDVQIKRTTAEAIENIANLSYLQVAKITTTQAEINSLLLFVRELILGLTDIELKSIKK